MATPAPLLFYFDFISPYAYLGWSQVHAIAERSDRQVVGVPVLFAALLNAHGQLGPAEIPAKRIHVFKDAYRKAHRFGLPPLEPPPSHPFNPLIALRVASVAAALGSECTDGDVHSVDATIDARTHRAIIDALFAATWATGDGIETTDQVTNALRHAASTDGVAIDVDGILRAASSATIKARLRTQTEAAVARGVFGVPTVYADGECFWGCDTLEFVEPFLRGEDPLPKDLTWADRPASAVRSR